MPTPIKKIIHYKNADKTFAHYVYDLDTEFMLPYAAGEFQELAPNEKKLSGDSKLFCDQSLFNNVGLCSIIEKLGENGALYIELQPGKKLSEIHVEPDGLMVDLLITKDGGLLYQFYNASDQEAVSVKVKIAKDKDNIYSKIKAHGDDLEYRQFFLKQALKKPGVNRISKPKIEYPEWLTAEQVAEIFSVKLKTIQNKTTKGELILHDLGGGTKRYKKSELNL